MPWLKAFSARWRAQQQRMPAAGSRVRDRLRREWVLLTVLMLALAWWLADPQQLQRSNFVVQDGAARLLQQPATPEIVLVDIDEESVAAIGRWPWRRAIHAQLVRQLSAQNPKAIALDILFSEADLDHPADDLLLADAMADSGRVVLPFAHDLRGQMVEPLPVLAQAAAALGHVQLAVDSDGGVRRFAPYVARDGEEADAIDALPAQTVPPASAAAAPAPSTVRATPPNAFPHLGLAMLCLQQPGARWCRVPAAPLPAPRYIQFASGYPAFATYSYIDVVRGTIPPSAFRGKYVVVGSTATGIRPRVPTPSRSGGPQAPGMAIVAHILNGALADAHPAAASPTANRLFNAIPVGLALVALALLGPSAALLACALLWTATLALATYTPLGWQVVFSPAAALLLMAAAYPLWSWRRLNAAAHFLEQEMRDLAQGGVLPSSPGTDLRGDLLGQRIQAVEQASRQLRDLHHFVSESLLQLPSPTLVCDTQGRILLANSAAHQYAHTLGRPLHERQDIELLLAGAQERETQQPLFAPMQLAGTQSSFQREGTDAHGNHLLLVGRPFSAPPTQGWLLTLVDITRMRQAMAQRDQAMHFISHDIRAPIGAIVTLLEMERSFGPGTSSASAVPATAPAQASSTSLSQDMEVRIERYARTALAMADDFVHLARAQQQPPRQEEIELNQLMDQALDDIWAAALAKSIDIDWMPQEAEALITGDTSQLRRVLVNMLTNAIKYSPAHSCVHCSLEERPAHWVVALRDEGDGISPEQQQTLFAPFTRLQQHENSRINGVGLGLAFVHTVMQRHGATIEIDSTVGTGTTFRLVFAKRA